MQWLLPSALAMGVWTSHLGPQSRKQQKALSAVQRLGGSARRRGSAGGVAQLGGVALRGVAWEPGQGTEKSIESGFLATPAAGQF